MRRPIPRTLAPLACVALLLLASGPVPGQSNPLARFAPPPATLVNGRWNGVDLERRSNCTNAENNGSRGTYAQFDVASDATGAFGIAQSGITGLNCNYAGRFQTVENRLLVQGNYTCSDGKQGTFQTTSIAVNPISLDIQMAIRLTGTESCTIDGILSMARFPL